MNLPLWTLVAVLTLIAFRRLGGLRLAIWQIVLGGALVVLLSGRIHWHVAWKAIDWEVIGFLFGVFVLGQALTESGLLARVSTRLLGGIRSADGLVLGVLLGSGLASALLMNDTLAVIGTPLMLALARAHRLPPRLLLLALAFGITTGSVMSPIGNPQNLLIALHGGLASPFLAFLGTLAVPSLINLVLAWGALRLAFWRDFHGDALVHDLPALADPDLARLAALGLGAMGLVIGVKVALAALGAAVEVPLWAVAAAACAPVLLASRDRLGVTARIDWHTLIFFAALFVLVRSVWETGVVQSWLPAEGGWETEVPLLLAGSALLSQLVSNVPLVALALPVMEAAGSSPQALLALAAGSTIAGNLTLVGAASNVIVAQAAERRGEHLGFWRFLAVGAPLTGVQLLVYWMML
ncbi:MAG: SLC13 family permease [Bdellovibrio bacteriovorus]